MILTVTPNTTIDLTIIIPSLTPNKTIRAVQSVYSMGGKPTDASWILGEIGIPSLALGFTAGATGDRAQTMLRARGVTADFIPVGGETRINVVIMTQDTHSHTTLTTSTMVVEAAHVAALREKYAAALRGADCVVLGGTLPSGMTPAFYADCIALANAHHVPTIFDATDANLRAGLEARPTFIKPNRDELSALLGREIHGLEEAYLAGREIVAQYGTQPIMTFGGDGALAVLRDRAYFIPPLSVPVVSPAGAGDAVLAGLAASFARRQPIEEGLKLGTAAAAAVCMLPGTADCRREDVERLLPQVELRPYPERN